MAEPSIILGTVIAVLTTATLAGSVLALQLQMTLQRITRANRGRYRGIVSQSLNFPGPNGRESEPIVFGIVGDSLAAGLGADEVSRTPSQLIGAALSARIGRPVRVVNVAAAGARSSDLPRQIRTLLARCDPDTVLIVSGANDVPHLGTLHRAAEHLASAVGTVGERPRRIIVGSCPDLGTVIGLPQPLRWTLGVLSHRLIRLQRRAVDGRAVLVALHETASPAFAADPSLLAADRFHPSGNGYELVVSSMIDALVGGSPEATARFAPPQATTEAA